MTKCWMIGNIILAMAGVSFTRPSNVSGASWISIARYTPGMYEYPRIRLSSANKPELYGNGLGRRLRRNKSNNHGGGLMNLIVVLLF
jgi:hypothetical protein